jgi:hypothetical protein
MCAPEFQPATLALKKAILKWAGSDQAGAVQLVRVRVCVCGVCVCVCVVCVCACVRAHARVCAHVCVTPCIGSSYAFLLI